MLKDKLVLRMSAIIWEGTPIIPSEVSICALDGVNRHRTALMECETQSAPLYQARE